MIRFLHVLLLASNCLPMLLCIEFSFEDFRELSELVRKRLIYSWEADMEFTQAKEVIIAEVDRRIITGELEMGGSSKAPELADKVASSLSELLSRRGKVVDKISSFVQNQSIDFTWQSDIRSDDVSVVQMKDNFPVVRSENFGEDVNTSCSAVHIPVDIYDGSKPILNDMSWSQNMDEVFINNSRSDPSVNWQYFASGSGWLRQWPAKRCERNPDLYDARMEPWYLEGLSAPKHLLILIDTSGSTHGMVMRLIKVVATSLVNMLADWDRVYVASFATDVDHPTCWKRFVSATPVNKQLISEEINRLKSKDQAQLEPALKFALNEFQKLSNTSSPDYDGYPTCNKFVAILTDGDETFDPDDFVEDYRNISTRIFVYGIGPTITGESSLQALAEKTNGEYSKIIQMNAIRHTIQNLHLMLSTLSNYKEQSYPVLIAVSREHDEDHQALEETEVEKLFNHQSMSHSNLSVNVVRSPIIRKGYQPTLALAKVAFNVSRHKDNIPPKVIGVAGADIRTPEIINALNPVLYDPAGYAMVVAHNGYVILHSRYVPRNIGLLDNENPNVIAFTEVPTHLADSEFQAVELLKEEPGRRDRHTVNLLYFGNKDYASEERRWLAYTPVANSSLGVVVSIRENGMDSLEPTSKLPVDFSLREVALGEAPYFVDLRRICGAAGGVVSRQISRWQTPPPTSSTTTPTTTSTKSTTKPFDDDGSGAVEEEFEEDLTQFGQQFADFELTGSVSDSTTSTSSSTTTTMPTTTTPAPDYEALYQEAAVAFLQQFGNNDRALKRHFCDKSAVRKAGLDMILLRKLINTLGNLRLALFNETVAEVRPPPYADDEDLPKLFDGEAIAWAIVFPSGVYFSSPPDGLTRADITDPHKLSAYQHAAYVRDQVYAQPAPKQGYSVVARSIHMRSMPLGTILLIYNSSSLLPANCTNCMLFDDGGFLLAATNKSVARNIGLGLELLDYSLYKLLVQQSNVYTSHSGRMLVRPCPFSDDDEDGTESAGFSHLLQSSLVTNMMSVSWWASLFSTLGKTVAEVATDYMMNGEEIPPEILEAANNDSDIVVEDDMESEQKVKHEAAPPPVEEKLEERIDVPHDRAKCSRESLADDFGLPRKGRICAIRHPTLVPGSSFYIGQLRPFACDHFCTRAAAWAPVLDTNLLFVVADPPCAGCSNLSPTKNVLGFAYKADTSFNVCPGTGTGQSVFSHGQYFEQPDHIDWKCSPLVFPPRDTAVKLYLHSWLAVLVSLVVSMLLLPF